MAKNIRSFVVGTAGHIDHGKTALIEQITDANPDRLPEEQERDLTIDLGFAEYVMPDGTEVGIIDVPGHERFIRNMVAGATAMDFVILVVAADDGVMPQTREHLQIMELLDIQRGIPVITKIDLVEEILVEVVEDEMRDLLENTFLEEVPVSRVSSRTGQGFDQFIKRFESFVNETPERSPNGIFRMPVQRSFTIKGLGTVVTGVPVSGSVERDDVLEVLPNGTSGRVRGIQAHHRDIDRGCSGHRTALNLAEIDHEEVERGDLVCTPGFVEPGTVVDAKFHFVSSRDDEIEHWDPIRLHVGADECIGRIIPLEGPAISSGETTFVQLELDRPVAAVPGDPFVLRKQSPMITLGGGRILALHSQRKTRSDDEHLSKLKSLSEVTGHWREHARWQAEDYGVHPFGYENIAKACHVQPEDVKKWVDSNLDSLGWLQVSEGQFLSEKGFRIARKRIQEALDTFHARNPVLIGLPKHDLQNRTELQPQVLDVVLSSLEKEESITFEKEHVRLSNHSLALSNKLTEAKERIEEALTEDPFSTPSLSELRRAVPQDLSNREFQQLMKRLKQEKVVIEPEEGVFFHDSAIEEAIELVRTRIKQEGSVETGEVRDALDTSRKYTIPLLEHMDDIGITYRRDNRRYLVDDRESGEESPA